MKFRFFTVAPKYLNFATFLVGLFVLLAITRV